jgi:hypothetical protein
MPLRQPSVGFGDYDRIGVRLDHCQHRGDEISGADAAIGSEGQRRR